MKRASIPILLAVLAAPPLLAQGRTDYFNVESPQVHPIEVARVGGHDYLLVCNTPDNRVEIYDTDDTLPLAERLLARVQVGVEPVTVRYFKRLGRFYTANFLGDTISVVRLEAPSGPASLTATLEQTTWVGDEPVDFALFLVDGQDPEEVFPVETRTFETAVGDVFEDGHVAVPGELPGPGEPQPTLIVTHTNLGRLGWRDALTLEPVIDNTVYLDPLVDDVVFGIPIQRAPKEPRTVLVRGNKLVVMAFKGGQVLPGETEAIHDLDLWCADVDSLELSFHGGLGSTNFNMAFAGNGDLFLVGGEAQNHLTFEKNVAAAATGFVKSTFYYVKNPCTASFDFQVRDVNLELGPLAVPAPVFADPSKAVQGGIQIEPQLVPQPVKKRDALAQPTDVVPYEPDGTVTKVFFTAFGSDRIGVIVPVFGTDADEWDLERINLRTPGGPVRGPRGLAVKYANDEDPDDVGNRLYVANRFDQSVTVIDPDGESVLDNFDLAADPRPDHLVEGQPFLYDARLSGNGFNACASCHYDGRTDKTRWHLGIDPDDPDAPDEAPEIPLLLLDGVAFDPAKPPVFPLNKGFLVTQTLQGLLNWDVEPDFQELFTNAPYHWRGDRATFLDFSPAFESLLGGSELAPDDMERFRTFINTIHLGSNPQQPLGRRFSGTFGDPAVGILDDDTATGGLRGLRLFHSAKTVGNRRSCIHCHTLHEASNNRITEPLGGLVDGGFPVETAQMRSLLQREARLEAGPASEPNLSPVTGREGLFHDGDPSLVLTPTINGFNRTFFLGALCPDDQPGIADDFDCENLVELNRASHQLDFGLAPIAALAYTVTADNLGDPLTDVAFTVLEDQADRANAGYAVQVFANGQQSGYYYLPGEAKPYVPEPFSAGPAVERQDVIDLVTGDVRVVLTAAPLGSERRLAAPTGVASTPASNRPTDVELLPLKPSEPYADVPSLTENWDDFVNQGPNLTPMLSVHTTRLYQLGLQQDAASENGFGFGLGPLHHDVPRRFQVRARNVAPGARLCLFIPNTAAPPNLVLTPERQGIENFIKITLPIHPFDDGTPLPEGHKVWETAVEIEQIFYYAMMLGGFEAPGVKQAAEDLTFLVPDPPPVGFFDPIPRNFHYVRIVNPDDDGTGNKTGDGGWQRLTLSPP